MRLLLSHRENASPARRGLNAVFLLAPVINLPARLASLPDISMLVDSDQIRSRSTESPSFRMNNNMANLPRPGSCFSTLLLFSTSPTMPQRLRGVHHTVGMRCSSRPHNLVSLHRLPSHPLFTPPSSPTIIAIWVCTRRSPRAFWSARDAKRQAKIDHFLSSP